jgi:hypothetical protein
MHEDFSRVILHIDFDCYYVQASVLDPAILVLFCVAAPVQVLHPVVPPRAAPAAMLGQCAAPRPAAAAAPPVPLAGYRQRLRAGSLRRSPAVRTAIGQLCFLHSHTLTPTHSCVQVEMKRLGIPREIPCAVQQWEGLIAVNYPARNAGVTRHMRVGGGAAAAEAANVGVQTSPQQHTRLCFSECKCSILLMLLLLPPPAAGERS